MISKDYKERMLTKFMLTIEISDLVEKLNRGISIKEFARISEKRIVKTPNPNLKPVPEKTYLLAREYVNELLRTEQIVEIDKKYIYSRRIMQIGQFIMQGVPPHSINTEANKSFAAMMSEIKEKNY